MSAAHEQRTLNRFEKGFRCPTCDATGHHIFNFAPSSKYRVAVCGQKFDGEDNSHGATAIVEGRGE